MGPGNKVATLDYGTEAAGYPFLKIRGLSGLVQLEAKYAEQFPALDAPSSDGPWTFVGGTGTGSFRVETFNVTVPGRLQSSFAQGGQRWHSLRLLTNGSVTLIPGFQLTSTHIPPDSLPGKFVGSNNNYTNVYDLGGRAVQAACVDAGAAPAVWEVSDEGALIRGQTTAQSALGLTYSNYTLSFCTKIVRGGTGFRIASGETPFGSYFLLTSNYPESSTFVNINRTLLPANHLIYGYGFGLVDQTTLPVPPTQSFPLSATIEEGKWYIITASILDNGFNVTLDGNPLAFVPITEAVVNANSSLFGSGSAYTGTWGFGPWQDQIALVKDVKVISSNGSTLYQNSMTSSNVLEEYGVAANKNPVCLDGGKRDRLVWIGDFVHTLRTVLASTNRSDYLRGSILQALEFAATAAPYAGFAGISTPLGLSAKYMDALGEVSYALLDYQDLFLVSIGDYHRLTGDLTFMAQIWPQIKTLVATRLTLNDASTGLTAPTLIGEYFLGGPAGNSTGVSAANALALQGLASIASALGDSATASEYTQYAELIGRSLKAYFWNSTLGTYSASASLPSDFDLPSIAFTIRAGIANASQTTSMLATLPSLRLGIGYKTGSYTESSNSTVLSPFVLGFLLEAIMIANQRYNTSLEGAQVLLDEFWPAMVKQDKYYSGASWEYMYPDGSPGLDLFTSLAHPWGSAPTYVLPEYVLGISATSPGYKTWNFRPLVQGPGLTNANGTVQTPFGAIVASWVVEGDEVVVVVEAPADTEGMVVLPGAGEFMVRGPQVTRIVVGI